MASEKAIHVWQNRKTPVPNYYAGWNNWLPIMRAYEERRPLYFGTPAVNLIVVLETSLNIICKEGMDKRVKRHQSLAKALRARIATVNLMMLPKTNTIAANTLTALYFPEGVDANTLSSKMLKANVIIAGGLLPEIKTSYFRICHMGSVSSNELMAVLAALQRSLLELGHPLEIGKSLQDFQTVLIEAN
jgi:alanine-glyoxylate transaminase/serine-glyoxylate transaminase/serine-pyruvate transaminase